LRTAGSKSELNPMIGPSPIGAPSCRPGSTACLVKRLDQID